MPKYHIDNNGVVGVCRAKSGKCPYNKTSTHFDYPARASVYSDNLNEFISKSKPLTASLRKIVKFDEIFSHHEFELQLANVNKKIQGKFIHTESLYNIYKKKREKRKKPVENKDKWIAEMLESDDNYMALLEKKSKILKEIFKTCGQRREVLNLIDNHKEDFNAISFSKASASTYLDLKRESLDEFIKTLDKEKYDYKIRPDIKDVSGENLIVRVSDHDPLEYLKLRDDRKVIWEYTDCSILVTMKKVNYPNFTEEAALEELEITKKLSI